MKTKRVFQVLESETAPQDSTRARILEAARARFLRFGFTPVTTDAIATSIGISKATLYKYFPSKEELFRTVIFDLLKEIEAGVERLVSDRTKDFAGRLSQLLSYIGVRLTEIGGILSLDMQRSAPDVWRDFEIFRGERILSKLSLLLEEGHGTGVFRGDVNKDFFIRAYLSLIEQLMNPEALEDLSLSLAEAFRMIVSVMLEGILTEKGRVSFRHARSLGPAGPPKE